MTIAVDLGRKATKQTNKQMIPDIGSPPVFSVAQTVQRAVLAVNGVISEACV